jgi:hypothetical protein
MLFMNEMQDGMKKFDLGPVISEFVLWTHNVKREIILTNTP